MRLLESLRRYAAKHASAVLVIGVFILLGGIYLLQSSSAGALFISQQPEAGAATSGATVISDTSASGGKAVKFGSSTTTTTPHLPINLASTSTLRASPKKVFAHYFTPHPLSVDNKVPEANPSTGYAGDYYTKNYLQINGVDGEYAAGGGKWRDRPLTPARTTTDSVTRSPCPLAEPLPRWRVDDMRTEIRRAKAAGIDGFTMSILMFPKVEGESGYTTYDYKLCQNNYLLLSAAIEEDPAFKIILRPSMPALDHHSAQKLADELAVMAKYSSAYRLADGRVVISPFHSDFKGSTTDSANYWKSFLDIMKGKGIKVAFVPSFLNYPKSVEVFDTTIPDEYLYGFSEWGRRSPGSDYDTTMTNLGKRVTDAQVTRKKIWMQPVSVQDFRPKDAGASYGTYYESKNSENLRLHWEAAIKYDAAWIDMPTWNDFGEHSTVGPSVKNGYAILDIVTNYLARYKAGSQPSIVRDTLYLSHRPVKHEYKPPSPQVFLTPRTTSNAPSQNTIEVLSYLTAPANITVKIGTASYTYAAPAGVYTKSYPLATGTISASATRSGVVTTSVTSSHKVESAPDRQDLNYYYKSSRR